MSFIIVASTAKVSAELDERILKWDELN